MSVFELSITVLFWQFVFIGSRTFNVRYISEKNMAGALLSGAIVHIAWLVTIAIGAFSMNEIMQNFEWRYLPVVACSLTGGLVGTYVAMAKRFNKK